MALTVAAAAATAVLGIVASMMQGRTLQEPCHKQVLHTQSALWRWQVIFSYMLWQGTTALRQAHVSGWSPSSLSTWLVRSWRCGSSATPSVILRVGRVLARASR
jgi:hypothetical protein